jgi:hypothetical protein
MGNASKPNDGSPAVANMAARAAIEKATLTLGGYSTAWKEQMM